MEFEYVRSPLSLPRGGWRFNGDATHGSRGWRWFIVRRDPPAPASSCAKPARLAGDVVTVVAFERSRGRFNLGHQVVQLIGTTGEVIRLPDSLKHGVIVGVGRPGHPGGIVYRLVAPFFEDLSICLHRSIMRMPQSDQTEAVFLYALPTVRKYGWPTNAAPTRMNGVARIQITGMSRTTITTLASPRKIN